ncbi:MAG TPA: FtsX-like permease family protein [Blastocatellia bacterium]|nr:FtsX-like permease family protein [Blastocatellia bacterium]
MKAYFRLFRQFILRAIARDRARSAITVLGISLGVGVMIAIRMANASSLEAFRTAGESIAGDTSIQITGAAGRFDESILRDLDWLGEYVRMSPVITGYAMTEAASIGDRSSPASGPTSDENRRGAEGSLLKDGGPPVRPSEFLQVLGVDVLRDRALRRYQLLRLGDNEAAPNTRQFLELLVDSKAIVLTEKFARRHNLTIGGQIALITGGARREFTVRGLLLDEGPARALDGNFALMDIAAAQLAFSRLGLLDRVDVKLKPGTEVDAVEAEIASRLPASLAVTRPQEGYGQVEKMIAAFHFNLTALGSIALLVGLFLIYNTVSISVITRREEIGALRAVGAARAMVVSLFLGEALLFALAGAGIGLGLGRLMANAAIRFTATTVETFYVASAATQTAGAQSIGLAEIVLAFAVALPLASIAASLPALEASRVRPIEAMRGADRLAGAFKPSLKLTALALVLFGLGYALSRLDAVNGLPLFGYAAALSLTFGGAFLVPASLWLACRIGGRISAGVARAVEAEGKLASANLNGAIPRVSISVAALAVSLAMMVAISIMIGSFRLTVSYWLDQTLKADIYAKPVTRTSALAEGEIDEQAVASIRGDPQVAAVDPFTSRQVSYQGNLISLGAGDFGVLLEHGRLLFKVPSDARDRLREAIGRDAVAVSESFSLRFRKAPGDTVELPTPAGSHRFTVIAVYYDYSSNRGTVVMDRTTYSRLFDSALPRDGEPASAAAQSRPSSLNIYLNPGVDASQVKERLERLVGSRYQLIFTTNSEVRREVMKIFDSTFAITYALELIAILVAGLGVISTLITLILERRREIAILSFLGATRRQIRRMILIEAITIGGVSQGVGVLIGVMLSLVLVYVINVQSFGWTIQFSLPVGFLIRSTLLILAVAAVGGIYPASRAAKVDAVRFAREE